MSFICALWGHKGYWSPFMQKWYCRWCHEDVYPVYK